MRLPAVLTRNFRLKFGCAVLAIVTWAGVVYAGNPPATRTLAVHVPQQASSIPPGYRLIGSIPDLALRVAGTRNNVNAFDASTLVIAVNWRAVTHGGVQSVPVTITKTDPNVDLLAPPTSVTVDLDRLASVSVQVVIVPSSPPPVGYRTTDMSTSPSTVSVSGPEHELHDLQARVIVDLSNQRANFAAQVNVLVFGSQGERLNDVGVDPHQVSVSIGIASDLTSRALAVVPHIVGKVASGYVLSGITVSPLTVVLSGPQDLLNGLVSVSTSTISINGLTANDTLTVPVTVSGLSGVTATPGTVTVTLVVTALSPPTPTPTPTPSPVPTP